jgi:imidazolonepropionase-like amidohydrolase
MKILKRITFIFVACVLSLVLLFFIGVFWPKTAVKPVVSNEPYIIKNINIVDIENDALVLSKSVLIEQGKIKSILDSSQLAVHQAMAKTKMIDGDGQYLMPSLWDMHAHVFKTSPKLELPLYIAYGVTNVRDMTGCPTNDDPFIACTSDKRRWTQQANDGLIVGPRIVSSASFMVNGPSMLDRMPNLPEYFGTATPELAREFVRQHAGKVDAIKIYNNIPRESYFALVDEARRLDVTLIGHRPHAISTIEAAQNQKSIEHARFILHESFAGSDQLRSVAGTHEWHEDRRRMVDEHDPGKAQAIFSAMKDAGTWYVPTHLTRHVDAYADDSRILEDPLLDYLHPLMYWQWLEDVNKVVDSDPSPEARQAYRDFYTKGLELTYQAHKAGVKVLLGTDYLIGGPTVHQELVQLVSAGLSPAEALRAATVSAAEYYGLEDQYGAVKEGMAADLVILRQNPLEDIRASRSMAAVIFGGNYYDRSALDGISEHVRAQARSWAVACQILWEFIKSPVNY